MLEARVIFSVWVNENMANIDQVELYKLVGRYEATTIRIFEEFKEVGETMKEMNGLLQQNNKDHEEIKRCIVENTHRINSNDSRLKSIEETGVSKKTQLKIDGSLLGVVLLGIYEFLKRIGVVQ